jgi:hypothetical protein
MPYHAMQRRRRLKNASLSYLISQRSKDKHYVTSELGDSFPALPSSFLRTTILMLCGIKRGRDKEELVIIASHQQRSRSWNFSRDPSLSGPCQQFGVQHALASHRLLQIHPFAMSHTPLDYLLAVQS